MFGILQSFNTQAEIRESKDEILVGEIVRAMARRGRPAISFRAHDDRQEVRFKTPQDPVLFSVFIALDRMTGSGMVSQALLGSKATLRITAEIKNRLSDPDDLVKMYRTDLANIFKMPMIGDIKLNHAMNSVFATTQQLIEIDQYVLKGEPGVEKMCKLLDGTIGRLEEKLRPYKK